MTTPDDEPFSTLDRAWAAVIHHPQHGDALWDTRAGDPPDGWTTRDTPDDQPHF